MDKKPKRTYLAFVIAFAIEMHGIPFSMYLISLVLGKKLPNGILWGHTFFDRIGFLGMYINIGLTISGLIIIINGWYHIYHQYWKKEEGQGKVVNTGIYKHIRHPQYLGLFLISTGMLVEWMTLPLLVMFPVIIIMYVRLAKREEQDMIEEFGEEYKSYMEATKMFIPKII
jgi:protein-S-isoprenylcysteine O-methyltransferase Ste14